jgi:small conductance mechanosensitive channel
MDLFIEYYHKILDKLEGWLDSAVTMLPNFILAILITTLAYFIARYGRTLTTRIMHGISKNTAINKLIGSVAFIFLFVGGLFTALSILNLDQTVASLLAGAGIIGLAIGFAFKDIAANFLAGIYMAIKSPINVGDVLEYQDVFGIVKNIGLRASSIQTFQGQDVVVPNRLIIEEKYTHYTINRERRIDLDVGISYGDDLEKAEKVAIGAVKKIDYLKKDKPVDLFYLEFGDSAINFTIRYWITYNPGDGAAYYKALSQGIKNIKKAFEENDITITFPIRTLDFGIKGGTSLAEMLEEKGK